MIRLLLMLAFFGNCQNRISQAPPPAKDRLPAATTYDPLLAGIQQKIKTAFKESRAQKNSTPLLELNRQLDSLYTTRPHNLTLYWRAYLRFYRSLYHLIHEEKKAAEEEVQIGIEWLKKINNKNSEDYALLSHLVGYSIRFNPVKGMFLGPEADEYAGKAVAMDSTNLRAWLVRGANDFYTPAMFGGGKKAEKYLLKALAMPDQKTPDEYLPSWGRDEVYELLVRLYIKEKKWDVAKKYYAEAIAQFPNNHLIVALKEKLEGK